MSEKFAETVRKANRGDAFPNKLLALDPGGTTGWAYFEGAQLTRFGQCTGTHSNMRTLLTKFVPDIVVCEDYLVYPWALRQHRWSKVPTLRLIGGIESQCTSLHLPLYLENAQVAKGFCTDTKLRAWGYYKEGLQHARDAIRHGCYYLIFSPKGSRTPGPNSKAVSGRRS